MYEGIIVENRQTYDAIKMTLLGLHFKKNHREHFQ